MTPIGIYVRVSRKGDREDERFHSPREQRERATSLVLARGLEPGPLFEDIDVSGARAPAERPGMGALLGAIKAGGLGGLAAFSLDRLSREPSHGDALVKAVTGAGGVILTPDIPDAIDSPTGEFTFGMLLQVAKLYRSQSGARFQSAKERAIREGIPVSDPPVGYRRGPDRRLELDPSLAPVVRDIFERRAAGERLTPLATLLGERTGRAWTLSGVAAVLRNRLYATGRLEYASLLSDHLAGAVVDEPLWHAAQNVSLAPREPRSRDAGWLLTGLVRCESCGRALSVQWSGPEAKYRRYRCRNLACRARANVHAGRLEEWVRLHTFAFDHELSTRNEAPDLGALEDALVVSERRLAQVMAPGAADDLGDLWAPEVRRRREARDEAARALGRARVDAPQAREFRLEDVWDDLSPIDRRASLALVWKEIRVGRNTAGSVPLRLLGRPVGGVVEVSLPVGQNGQNDKGPPQGP